jgi:protein tyrosine/serine phosphatase
MYRNTLPKPLLPALVLSLAATALFAHSDSDVPGVGNFHQVNEHVYRGAQPSDKGFASLARLGVKTVIDLRGQRSEQKAVQNAGLHYVRMPWNGYKAPDEKQIAAVLSLMNDNTQWPVFVHCRRGADRTGTAIACYRILHDHWTNEQALSEAKTFGMSSLEVAMQHYIMNFQAGNFLAASGTPATAPAPTPALILAPVPVPAP